MVFYIQIWFKCETPPLSFLMKAMVPRKKLYRKSSFFSVDYVKILNYMLYTRDVTSNLRWWNNGGSDLSIKKIDKN